MSFVFVGRRFQYAVPAPDRDRRWELVPYTPTDDDLSFAQRFVAWNARDVGVQRVDACRTRDGGLLLAELVPVVAATASGEREKRPGR